MLPLVRIISRPSYTSVRRLTAVPLAYTRVGDTSSAQTPLVIGHGLFGQKQNWTSVSKALQRRLNAPVFTLDFRNHGDSPWTDEHTYELMAADLRKFIVDVVVAQTSYERVHLLGHSMGGKAVAALALQPHAAEHIAKLIVEDVSPHRGSSRSLFIGYVPALQALDLTKPRRHILADLERVVPELSVRQFLLTNLVLDPANSGSYKWKINLAAVGKSLEHVLQFHVRDGQFDRPTLFVYGAKSAHLVEADKQPIRSFFPNVVFHRIADAGHWVHAEQPALFVDAVVDFLTA